MGKKAFEKYAEQHGVTIRNYHGDNGIFKEHGWMDHCTSLQQGITFTGVSSHHQNGIARRRIGLLQELTRANLLHTMSKWPSSITPHFWPYSMRMANDAMNNSPNLKDKARRTPLEAFTESTVNINQKHWKPFRCPVAVLARPL